MQTMIFYGIGILAVSYFAVTLWKQAKGEGQCACSEKCGGCGKSNNCK